MSMRRGQAADLAMTGYPCGPHGGIAEKAAIPYPEIPVAGEDTRRRVTPAQEPATDGAIAAAIVDTWGPAALQGGSA
jgi:hypothetical protein